MRAAAGTAGALAGLLAVLGLSAVPADAHVTGPQLISHFGGFSVPAPGVRYSLLSTGSAPYATVSVSGNHTFEIFGHAGEHFIKITNQGVFLNRNSPSVEYLVNDPSKPIADFPAVVTTTVSWEQVSTQTTYNYYERRAEWPHTGQPAEAQALDQTAVVFRGTIPASYDGTDLAIDVYVTWIPSPFNIEIPLLFIPIVVVLVLWVEPTAKRHVAEVAAGTAAGAWAGVAIGVGVTALTLASPPTGSGSGLARLAPAAILPGLAAVAAAAAPRVRAGNRRAYAWVALFGLFLLAFGAVRLDLLTASASGLATWLHQAELVAGILIAAAGGLLLFLTRPARSAPRRAPGGTGPPR